MGGRTSASCRARTIQEQHALFRERPPVVSRHRRERRGNLRATRAGADIVSDRSILRVFEVAAAAMVCAERAPCPVLSFEAGALDGVRGLGALAVRLSRAGIRA